MSTKNQPLLIRADASARMGTGHIMRCLALAQAWREEGGTAIFATAELPPSLAARLAAEQCPQVPITATPGSPADAEQFAVHAGRLGSEWVVVDGYHFGADYQDALKAAGYKLLFIDDYGHAGRYPADLVLNQNLGADAAWYRSRGPATELLLGPKYALLRREFWAYRNWQRTIPDKATKLLITLGGADPDNVTRLALEAVRTLNDPDLHTIAVVGGSNPHRAELAEVAETIPGAEIRVDVHNMPELMAWADLALAAGGTTTWERCLLGLPSIVVVLAENQEGIAKSSVAAGIAVVLRRLEAATTELAELIGDRTRRADLATRSQAEVDGWGSQRVCAACVHGEHFACA